MLNVTNSDIKSSDIIYVNDTVYYDITLVRKPMTCPYCGGNMIGHGHKLRLIKHPALRDHNGIIRYHANRYICKECMKTAFERDPFAFDGFNSSFYLMQNAMRLIRNLNYNLKMISEELNISTTQLNRYIDSYITIPPRPLPESLGIDELHSHELSRRNASYLCILVDNERRTVWDILDSRSKLSLSIFFSRIPREERLKVKYVTIDMWEPYRDVAKTYFPNCIVAVDPFHVIKHLVKDFDDLRIDLMKKSPYGSNAYYLLKKWSWLLVKSSVDLDNEKVYNNRFKTKLNRRDLRGMIFSTFPELSEAYDIKELYRRMNNNCSYDEAAALYDDILQAFKSSGIRQYNEFTEILINWKEEILNSYLRPYDDRKLSNSFTENVNGKLRTYLSVSRGISNFSRFRKRVLYALSKDVQYALSSSLSSDSISGKKRGPYNKIHY
ncbi:MAG: ISL3 family transposase [Firmicutes bacterium]|nr:ISL3 family transposase [Bacillota bacterium]